MKKYLFLLILLFVVNFLNAQIPSFDPDKTIMNISDDTIVEGISSIRYQYYNLKDDSLTLEKFSSMQEYIYDGNQISTINFISLLNDSIYSIYKYDSRGRIINEIRIGNEILCPLIKYKYDLKEMSASKTDYTRDSIIQRKKVIFYNKFFQPIRTEEYKQDSVLRSYRIFEYDECGQLVKKLNVNTSNGFGVKWFNEPFKPYPNDTSRFEIIYSSGCIPKKIVKYSNSQLRSTTEFSKAGDTLITCEKKYYLGDTVPIKTVTIKSLDSLRIIINNHHNSSPSLYKYKYLNGNKVESSYYTNVASSVIQYSYEQIYDEKGTWIEKRTFKNGNLISKVKRKVNYLTPANKS